MLMDCTFTHMYIHGMEYFFLPTCCARVRVHVHVHCCTFIISGDSRHASTAIQYNFVNSYIIAGSVGT